MKKRSLVSIAAESVLCGAIYYPVCSAVIAMATDSTFIENLKDKSTGYMTIGATLGYFTAKAATELYKRHKARNTQPHSA